MTEAHRAMIDRLNRLNATLYQLQNTHTCELHATPELPVVVATKPRATVTFAQEVLFHIVERRTSSTDTQPCSDEKHTAFGGGKREEELEHDEVIEMPINDSGLSLSEAEEVFS